MSTSLRSDFTLGFLGAGQLARMSAVQAFRFGIQVAVYSDRRENEPVQFMTPQTGNGSFSDIDAMVSFAKRCDLITLENEFIDSNVLQKVQELSHTPIYPAPESFALIENKLIEKQTFENAGIPVTPYALVDSETSLQEFGDKYGWPYLLKSSKGGYDGYGNEKVNTPVEALKAFQQLGGKAGHDILAEAFVDFSHELAVQVARNKTGTAAYPCCETIQQNHICIAVKTPAPISTAMQKKAEELAVAATEVIDGKGIFAFEFFLTHDGKLLLNESAPRPHNSGHYSIEGCITSQFENHVRAVLDLPLGDTSLRKPAAVMINLLGTDQRPSQIDQAWHALQKSDGHLHLYGKLQSKPGRKMGHYTLLGNDADKLYSEAKSLTKGIRI